MKADRDGDEADDGVPVSLSERLVAVNEKLVLSLIATEDRARTSARLLEEMSQATGPDGLTRLPNRMILLDRVGQATATARLNHSRLGLLSVHLGDHRALVERLGKSAGDAALRFAASCIRSTLGTVETVSRHGPDGFLVLLPEVLLDEAESVAERIIGALDARQGDLPRLPVHIGAAFFPDHGPSPVDLMADADAAMRRAVDRGDRSIVIFRPGMRQIPRIIPDEHGAPPASTGSGGEASDPGLSALQTYVCDANEQLLMTSIASLEERDIAESALRRQTDFLAILADELRTPLTPISLAAAMMSEVKADQIPRLQAVITRHIVHVSRLLTDLLELSRIHTGGVRLKREVVSIATVVSEAIDACKATAEARGQTLAVVWPKGQPRVLADAIRLAQVFSILLENASTYTPDGGRISLRVEADATSVMVTVDDTGTGISADILPRIFEPFARDRSSAARDGMGVGIGLAIVRDMVTAHGGRIVASSAGWHAGATFVVTLPRVTAR